MIWMGHKILEFLSPMKKTVAALFKLKVIINQANNKAKLCDLNNFKVLMCSEEINFLLR